MKKIILIVIMLMLCSCNSAGTERKNPNERINEEFLLRCKMRDQYDPMDTVVETEKRSAPDYSDDLAYAVFYLDKDGYAVRIDYYYAPKDILMYSIVSYNEGLYTYKSVFEYNREFYDHFDEYGLSVSQYTDCEKMIIHYGIEYNALGLFPDMTECYYADGSYDTSCSLLSENGQRYLYESVTYDADGNLTSLFRGNPEDSEHMLYGEYNTYENGVIVQKCEYDYVGGTETCTDYENGEPVNIETYDIDENGIRTGE